MVYARHWVFTVFSDEVSFFDHERVSYCIFGNERCPKTGRWHKQGYVHFKCRVRLTFLKSLDPTAHWEIKRGSVKEASDYCKKDGDFYEYGSCPVEERSNGNVFSRCIELAESGNMDELKQNYPGQFLRYKRTFDGLMKYPATVYTEPRGYWIFGSPGCGKDTNVMKLNPYVKAHNKWWDGYNGERYVLLSDFTQKDAEFLTTYLLQWTDRYPFHAEYKGGSVKISPERFYVTSNFSLETMYGNHSQYEALVRRFHVIDFDRDVVVKRPRIECQDKVSLIDF